MTCLIPPSARDFEVYESTAVLGLTTREAAAKFSLSQTRVCQILRRVAAFAAEVLAQQPESQIPAEQRLALSRNVAALRLDHLYQECMSAWRDSRGEGWRLTEPQAGDRPACRVTWKASGNGSLLVQASKLAVRSMELPPPMPLGALAAEEDDECRSREELPDDDRRTDPVQTAENPPEGDCSGICELEPDCDSAPAEVSPQVTAAAAVATTDPPLWPLPERPDQHLFNPRLRGLFNTQLNEPSRRPTDQRQRQRVEAMAE